MRNPQTGEFINGAQVMCFAELPPKPGHYDGGIVLCYDSQNKEFIVWLYVSPPEHHHRPAYCVDGGYYQDVKEALEDYLKRSHASRIPLRARHTW